MSQNFVTPPSEPPPFVTASAFAQYSVAARLPPLESPRSPDESESDDDEPGFEQLENFQPGVPAAQALPFQPTAMPAVPCAPGLPAAIATPTTPAPAPASSDFLHSEIVADADADDDESESEVDGGELFEKCGSRTERDGGFTGCILPLGHVGPHNLGTSGKRRTRGQPDYRERADAAVAAAPAAPPPPCVVVCVFVSPDLLSPKSATLTRFCASSSRQLALLRSRCSTPWE